MTALLALSLLAIPKGPEARFAPGPPGKARARTGATLVGSVPRTMTRGLAGLMLLPSFGMGHNEDSPSPDEEGQFDPFWLELTLFLGAWTGLSYLLFGSAIQKRAHSENGMRKPRLLT